MKTIRAILCLLLLLPGCRTAHGPFTLSTVARAGTEREIVIPGREPRLTVRNDGPGTLSVRIRRSEGAWELDPGTTIHVRRRGPVRLVLRVDGAEDCGYVLSAEGSEGLDTGLPRAIDGR